MLTTLRFLVLSLASFSMIAAAPRPNVVFFLIDDLGYADCGFNGGKDILTPNIDKLASEGAVLENHYVQPVCSPTRAALMTGRYATRTGVYTIVRPHAKWGLPLDERTLANALSDSGYTTAITGKWHLGEFEKAYTPTSRGFQHQHGHYFGAIDYFTHVRDGSHDWYHDDKELKEDGYSTHLITKEAVRLIEAQPKDKPLFLYMPYNGVHSPMQVPDGYLKPYGSLTGARRQLAGMLAAVDEGVGSVVAALEKSGLRENTLIIFSADNGGPPPGHNTPLRDFKGSIFEGGVRAAAFANWPGKIPAGQRITQPMHIIDWYPTLVKLAGGSLEQKLPLDGKDVWPVITEKAASPHDAILCVQSPQNAAVRMGDWKIIVSEGLGDDAELPSDRTKRSKKGKTKKKGRKHEPVMLFNLATDPSEKNNVAQQDPERVAAMKAKLAELLKDAVPSGVKK
jgi:arylsulfatase A-like enzyme